jgi:uncharacterized membrane protein YbhN (UPF0104 family)
MQGRHWKLFISVAITVVIAVVAFLNRTWLIEAFAEVQNARPAWIAAAFGTIALSYLISAQVFNIVLRSLGYRMGMLRLWATAIVAIVFSQSVPAGGVGSYAFLVSNFSRRGLKSGEATLLATLESLSYAVAMVLVFFFSLIYLAFNGLGAGLASYIAAGVAILVIGGLIYLLTRPTLVLLGWLVGLKNLAALVFRRHWADDTIEHIVTDLARARTLIASQPREVAMLVLVQLLGLSGHAIAMMMVGYALGTAIPFPAMLSAFGIALITSTFNVLPGGGGTVEAALVAVLFKLGVGAVAAPAAIIFRLLNFWLLIPIAALSYHWLMHEEVPARQPTRAGYLIQLD